MTAGIRKNCWLIGFCVNFLCVIQCRGQEPGLSFAKNPNATLEQYEQRLFSEQVPDRRVTGELSIGDSAPDITFIGLEQTSFGISELTDRGKHLVLIFSRTHRGPFCMQQLVELQKHSETFNDLNAELVFVFREESLAVNGLERIGSKLATNYKLVLDNQKKSSACYSPKPMKFDNCMIDSDGVVRNNIAGSLLKRAGADALVNALKSIQSTNE